jgi:alpha-mannosidase
MALSVEWRDRVESWKQTLRSLFYRPLAFLELEGFTTLDQLPAEKAARQPFRRMSEGTPWGEPWEYGWFRTAFTLPEEARGKRIELCLELGREGLVFVNASAAGSINTGPMSRTMTGTRSRVTLTRSGVPGDRFEVLAEFYAGHGPTPDSTGPVPHGTDPIPAVSGPQAAVGRSSYGIWNEEAYLLWVDLETLYQLRDNIDQDSLRVAEIDRALREFTLAADLELPEPALSDSIAEGRRILAPALACVNGSTAPTMYAFGHGHLDLAWLWPLAETERKAARTFANQLVLASEYPSHRYLQSQPYLYRIVKEKYPALYARVKKAVAAGTIVAEGGMWVEADTNLTGGESLIRQFLHGKRFFREEFGVDSKLLWLPDVFGYSGALPQILSGCGIEFFSTSKIFWAYHGEELFPYNTFLWEGIDGTRVLCHFCGDYNSHTVPAQVVKLWNGRVQKDGISSRLYPFGWGDGGGGPDRDHLEFLLREENLEGMPKMRLASPVEFFEELKRNGPPEAVYTGELYFQAHRGTYTSQARTKRGNRLSEIALREAELWSTIASAETEYRYPAEELRQLWEKGLLCQFHDILPGSSIARVYREAEAAYRDVIDRADSTAKAAMKRLSEGEDGFSAVFNSLSWERRTLVELPGGYRRAFTSGGEELPVQSFEGATYVEATLPSCGWKTVRHGEAEPGPAGTAQHPARVGEPVTLENDFYRLTFDRFGRIESAVELETGIELAPAPWNEFRMFKDVPSKFDAWDIDSMYAASPVPLPAEARLELVADGPLFSVLRITRALGDSMLTQDVFVRRHSRRVDFRTRIEWRERHRLLKVSFPTALRTMEAVHEIQFGHIARPNHHSRPFDRDRFEVPAHRWSALIEPGRGFAVLNDCKYGVSARGGTLSLTLLRSPTAPDADADRGSHEFTYSFYTWNGPFTGSGLIHEAYDLNIRPQVIPGICKKTSVVRISAPGVILETLKQVEDGSGDPVLRLYEAFGTRTSCTLTLGLPVKAAHLADMLEAPREELELRGGAIALEFRPFEIKTVRLTPR